MELKANCKINIGLDIIRKREDGYHELETIMYPVLDLYDVLHITRINGKGIEYSASGIDIDCPPEKNICIRAFELMGQRYGTDGLHLHLDKRVPFGAGLGGGSSDGTAVLTAINELYELHLTAVEMESLAAELGSDTPFFIRNTPQLCTGRGEIMSPVDIGLKGMTLVIAKPSENISTREAYSGITPHTPDIPLSQRIKLPVSSWRNSIGNDFESHVFRSHPPIAALKESMYRQGAVYASMSGSGSAVYGLFDADSTFVPPFDNVFLHKETIR